MRKRSILLLAGAVAHCREPRDRPSSNGERPAVGRDSRVHSRPGAGEPEPVARQRARSRRRRSSTNPILAGGKIYDKKVELAPFSSTATQDPEEDPLTVTFTYKPTAKWSDGKPVTGADFLATWQTIITPTGTSRRAPAARTSGVKAEGQERTSYVRREGVRRLGRSSAPAVLRTRSPGRTSTSCGATRSTSRAARSSSRAGRRARRSRSSRTRSTTARPEGSSTVSSSGTSSTRTLASRP